jgi:glycosyltransferase involved in cell wall biosynthesis
MRFTVLYDATAAARQQAGIGRYARELLRALAAHEDNIQYRVFYNGSGVDGSALPDLTDRFRVRALPVSDRVTNAVWHRLRLPLPIQTLVGGISLVHSPDFTAPPALSRPSIITIHDLAFEREPECAVPSLRSYLQRVVPRAARRATRVVAVSENTKRDVMDLYGIPEEKISVIYEGVATSLRQRPGSYVAKTLVARLGIAEPFILAVGTIEPRKNYPRLLDAYAVLRQRGLGRRLVIAGSPGWMYQPVFDRIRDLGLTESITLLRPSDDDLACLYAAADAFVYPSLYEGFGIPALEALSAGVPSAVTARSALPEVVGDAALLFDPTDVDAMADSIEGLLEDRTLAARLREAGPKQAAKFSWSRAAEQTVDLYRSIAGA